MRIEELIIEGFKSYPVRTHISGWDPSFNAITGLNGSGKSNILDAICFVLGITNMSVMRAANQQDLIYKRGQAGVTKASVTIVFDNSDVSKSPDGFVNCKQITVTRQIAMPNITKWLLNGHKAQQQTILSFFQSVQLNINNPNFVIMQGRITKVLNMRPQEILGMVEEAAGTRMFEERKDKAIKTMKKKEKKVEDHTNDLENEIKPKLQKLRAEKKRFLEYQKAVDELEGIAKTVRAHEYWEHQHRITKREAHIAEKAQDIEVLEDTIKAAQKEATVAEKSAKVLAKKRDAEIAKGGKLKALQAEANELDKMLAKQQTQAELKTKDIKEEEDRADQFAGEIEELEENVRCTQVQFDKIEKDFQKVKDKHSDMETQLKADEELLSSLLTGLSSNSSKSSGGGYLGQISAAKSRVAQAKTEEDQNKMKLSLAEGELKDHEDRMKAFAKDAKASGVRLQQTKAELEEHRTRLGKLNWSQEKEEAFEARLREVRNNVRNLGETRDRKKQGLSRLDFHYSDPYPNFQRSSIKGFAAQLITLPEDQYDKATALEITAGGKLYNIVIEDDKVGKALLDRGQLRKRVTFLPLNRISGRTVDPQKLAKAQSMAPGKVRAALSLVVYPHEVRAAIQHVFGDTLICDDADAASRITFALGLKSVTLQGDVYDPSGTMSGGSAPQGSGMLLQVQELVKIEDALKEARDELAKLEAEEARGRPYREAWRNLTRDIQLKEHSLTLLEEQIQGSNAAQIAAQVAAAKQAILDFREAVANAKQKQVDAAAEVKKLEKDMAEFDTNKDGKIDELKAKIKKEKVDYQKHATTLSTKQREYSTRKLELQQLTEDLGQKKSEVEEGREGLNALKEDLKKLTRAIKETEARCTAAAATLAEELAKLSRFDNELKALETSVKARRGEVEAAELEITKIKSQLEKYADEVKTSKNSMKSMEDKEPWIAEDKHNFGVPGGRYDFEQMDMKSLESRRDHLQKTQSGMKKKVNPKVVTMLMGVESREAELTQMLKTVHADKLKIEATIEELDQYKRDALTKTWNKVTKDFGEIFAELLPGNFAKLEPPEGQELMDGLEVKVRLGSVWKQSLTELSGGQRSLIALSLIMALLQFKPAPMYILDEIDAALDLSHTQHIGQLFRTRFKGSQFIVVSLKEGLFTNANVLFKAKFRDGTSIVERTAQRSVAPQAYRAEGHEEEDDGRRRRRGGGA